MKRSYFGGGQTADDDLREGSSAARRSRPSTLQMLFGGGQTADKGLRSWRDQGPGPREDQMLARGGEVEDDDLGVEVSDELIIAAEDIMDSLQGGYFGSSPSDSDSKVEKASKEAAKRARAKILAQSLKSFFMICESEPHSEG